MPLWPWLARTHADDAGSSAAAPWAPQLPDLSPFRAVRLLGRGSVGEVYLCRHSADGRLYAVKTVALDAPSWRLELLKREERIYASIVSEAGAHVGLLRACRVQLTPGHLCLVTEWASGGSLASFLSDRRHRRGVPEDLAAFILRQLWAAVERLHEHRVAYRDIKLDNILVDATTFGAAAPRLLLADFGTCKAWGQDQSVCLANTFMGTPGFMAPEVLGQAFPRRPSVTAATDGSSTADASALDAPPSPRATTAAPLPSAADAAASAGAAGRVGYDAVKADVYSMGAMLMYLLFKELPYGFDKFSRLLPPGEALALEREKSWREAAGAALLSRGIDPLALDLLDKMLDPDETTRISMAGIKSHPWFRQKLPRRYEAVLEKLERQQDKLDAARASLLTRTERQFVRAASLAAGDGAASGLAAAAAAAAALAAVQRVPPLQRQASGAERASETLFRVASDPEALERMRENGESLYVDLSPAGVADAWLVGVQSEPLRPGVVGLLRAATGFASAGGPPRPGAGLVGGVSPAAAAAAALEAACDAAAAGAFEALLPQSSQQAQQQEKQQSLAVRLGFGHAKRGRHADATAGGGGAAPEAQEGPSPAAAGRRGGWRLRGRLWDTAHLRSRSHKAAGDS